MKIKAVEEESSLKSIRIQDLEEKMSALEKVIKEISRRIEADKVEEFDNSCEEITSEKSDQTTPSVDMEPLVFPCLICDLEVLGRMNVTNQLNTFGRRVGWWLQDLP